MGIVYRVLMLILSGYLLVWVSIRFANELLVTIPSIGMRGVPGILELGFHGLVALGCGAAGWMLLADAPPARPAAMMAVAASATVSLQSLFWTALPSQTAPGQRPLLAILAVLHALFWIFVLWRAEKRSSS